MGKRKANTEAQIATNRAAFHNYFILESVEAGIELRGTEIKSLREGGANLREGFIRIGNGEAFLTNVHISPYERGHSSNHEVKRERKLLLHKAEIIRLGITMKQKGLTLVPLRLYWKGNRVKLEIGLAKGKRLYDKREAIAEREAKRDMSRAVRTRA
ncbi:MAG TPA: SsrA-binding protein SmpB [Candidatus Dormibacteraeota bacterium]|nr:SsrA-binding protein SmpB [Candidatus Dormibacteraeota bacterium]